jgi:hypothetical protein
LPILQGNPAAGQTTRDEPIARNRSQDRVRSWARRIAASGIACSNETVAVLIKPPQAGQLGAQPLPASMRARTHGGTELFRLDPTAPIFGHGGRLARGFGRPSHPSARPEGEAEGWACRGAVEGVRFRACARSGDRRRGAGRGAGPSRTRPRTAAVVAVSEPRLPSGLSRVCSIIGRLAAIVRPARGEPGFATGCRCG